MWKSVPVWKWVSILFFKVSITSATICRCCINLSWKYKYIYEVCVFPTDENNAGGDSDIDLQDEDTAQSCCSRDDHASLKSEELPRNRPALSKSDDSQDATNERAAFKTSDEFYSVEMDPSKKHTGEFKDGAVPVMLQTRGSSSLGDCDLQTLDFSGAHGQQFLKLGAPLLFHPGQSSVKPDAFCTAGMGHLFSSLSGENELENGGQSPHSVTSPSPFMFHLSQQMLASQVRFCTITHHKYWGNRYHKAQFNIMGSS